MHITKFKSHFIWQTISIGTQQWTAIQHHKSLSLPLLILLLPTQANDQQTQLPTQKSLQLLNCPRKQRNNCVSSDASKSCALIGKRSAFVNAPQRNADEKRRQQSLLTLLVLFLCNFSLLSNHYTPPAAKEEQSAADGDAKVPKRLSKRDIERLIKARLRQAVAPDSGAIRIAIDCDFEFDSCIG